MMMTRRLAVRLAASAAHPQPFPPSRRSPAANPVPHRSTAMPAAMPPAVLTSDQAKAKAAAEWAGLTTGTRSTDGDDAAVYAAARSRELLAANPPAPVPAGVTADAAAATATGEWAGLPPDRRAAYGEDATVYASARVRDLTGQAAPSRRPNRRGSTRWPSASTGGTGGTTSATRKSTTRRRAHTEPCDTGGRAGCVDGTGGGTTGVDRRHQRTTRTPARSIRTGSPGQLYAESCKLTFPSRFLPPWRARAAVTRCERSYRSTSVCDGAPKR